MRKYYWLVISILMSCIVSFIACDEANQMVKPVVPGTDSEVVEDDTTDTNALQNRINIEGATAISGARPTPSTAETAPTIQADVADINTSAGGTVNLPFEYSGENNLAGCIVCIEDVDGYFDLPYTGEPDALPAAIPVSIPQDAAPGSFTVCYSVYDDQDQYSNFITTVVNVNAPEVIEPTPPVVMDPPVVVDPIDMTPEGMVLIPAGEFQMGSSAVSPTEQPVHFVHIDAFYMDKYEVTNAQYAEFLNAKGKHTDADKTWLYIESQSARIEAANGTYSVKAGYENHPVVLVSWYGAMAYAEWAGKRLPTEAEWEKAARGGLTGQSYPWGDTINASQANYGQSVGDTTAVGTYEANGAGLFDVCGNVVEWCLDQYNPNFYASSPTQNPISGANSVESIVSNWTDVTGERVLRGGSFNVGPLYVRVAARGRGTPTVASFNIGFRCVKPVSP